jgi:hypothetical protein
VNWLALLVLGTAGAIVTAACLLFLLLRHRFHLRHRVDPAVATDAPMRWVVDPRSPGRLHRRLVKVGTVAGAVADDHRPRTKPRRRRAAETDPIHDAAVDLRAQAVGLDARLARLAVLSPAARRDGLRLLADQVTALEQTCSRLVDLSADASTPARLPGDDPAQVIGRRIDHLAEAHRELLALDDDAGIVAPGAPGAPDRTQVQPDHDRPTAITPTPPPPAPRPGRAGRSAG